MESILVHFKGDKKVPVEGGVASTRMTSETEVTQRWAELQAVIEAKWASPLFRRVSGFKRSWN